MVYFTYFFRGDVLRYILLLILHWGVQVDSCAGICRGESPEQMPEDVFKFCTGGVKQIYYSFRDANNLGETFFAGIQQQHWTMMLIRSGCQLWMARTAWTLVQSCR